MLLRKCRLSGQRRTFVLYFNVHLLAYVTVTPLRLQRHFIPSSTWCQITPRAKELYSRDHKIQGCFRNLWQRSWYKHKHWLSGHDQLRWPCQSRNAPQMCPVLRRSVLASLNLLLKITIHSSYRHAKLRISLIRIIVMWRWSGRLSKSEKNIGAHHGWRVDNLFEAADSAHLCISNTHIGQHHYGFQYIVHA